jgi:predicted Zn-dependent peptidase
MAAAVAATNVASEERSLEQAHLVLSWQSPPAGDDQIFATRLLAEIYGGGMSSRLFQEVREKRGLVYAIDAFVDGFEDCGRVGIYAGCAAGNAKIVATLAVDILSALAEQGPTAGELARAKAVAGAQLLMGAEAPLARADTRASQIFLRGRLLEFEELRSHVEAVTTAEVQAAAARALAGPNCCAVIGPKPGLAAVSAFQSRMAA